MMGEGMRPPVKQRLKHLRREIAIGLKGLDEGRSVPVDRTLARAIKRKGRETLERRSPFQNG
jgi:hypothetical protein